MPKKKSTRDYFIECSQKDRKSVPAAAYMEVFISRADLDLNYKRAQADATSLRKMSTKQIKEHDALAEQLFKAEKELEDVSFCRSQMDAQEQELTLRDRFAMAALVAMGAVVVAGEYDDTARAAYAIADGMIEGRGS